MAAALGVARPMSSGRRRSWPPSWTGAPGPWQRSRRPAAAAAGGGRDWDALSEATRKRYTGAGITREAYESGADLRRPRPRGRRS